MPPVTPDPARTRDFPSQAAFEAWLAAHHAAEPELWLKIHKKGSGLPTVTYAEALDVALCWGWIDGLKKSFDERSFLQRFTPRGRKSIWSAINVGHVERLVAEGRMTEHGQRHVEAAKADGRWERAYLGGARIEVPDDFRAALAENPAALSAFDGLNAANRYGVLYRVGAPRTPAGRAKAITTWVQRLAVGDLPHP